MAIRPVTGACGADAARCPHVIFNNVLGPHAVAGLLDHVAARQAAFQPAVVRDRTTGQRRIDGNLRTSLSIADLGDFASAYRTAVETHAAPALARLQLTEVAVAPRELEINAYGDGGLFAPHIDTNEQSQRVRVLSCVYYFARTPRPFTGGELRIHGLPTLSAGQVAGPPVYVDVAPEPDTMVMFPSWVRHEVMPVGVPSGAWLDGRFTLNCWLHRVAPAARPRPAGP